MGSTHSDRPLPPNVKGLSDAGVLLRRLGARRPLGGAVEHDLVRRAQQGDAHARAELVEALLPLVASVARTYRTSPTIHRTELLQEGVVGVLRALERYEPERGVPFWAYASWWVRQAMQQLVAELTRPAVLSDRALRHLARLKEAHRDVLQAEGREPSRDELAERSGLEPEQVDDLLAVERPARSLDAPPPGSDDAAVGTFGELIADPLAEDAYERVLAAIDGGELLRLLSGLSDREREVLTARYGLEGGEEESLRDIGSRLGLSGERVRQLERRALGKLSAAAGVED
ncbi:MAG TPA: sigma-70 family RNA polymerase sigma factor [Solirubrobacteraceae bacterium]|nr:sigma-70 family RNA polymerase sigma factor [Solirubrobacteraceae bacterium]